MTYELNLREVTYALSEALDYVGVDDTMHGKRVAYMAAQVARHMEWSLERTNRIHYIGMLHDCGVSSTDVHSHLINELDWDNAYVHAKRGAELLRSVAIYADYSDVVALHHTHWDAMPAESAETSRIEANLIYLVDRVDALRQQMQSIDNRTMRFVHETLLKYRGTLFHPELVDAFIESSSKQSFWFYLEDESLEEYFYEWVKKGVERSCAFKEIKEVAMMFAAVVDAKSTFTSEHSQGVASLSLYLARRFDLSQSSCEKIEMAGLLHDLGKLRVDDAVLNKPARLNADERLKMNRHGFDSDIILRRISGFSEIAKLASMHHETLDAQGYPYRLTAEEIPFEGRIIAVADIFQALVQDRPYRGGLAPEEAAQILDRLVEEHKVDAVVVAKLREDLDAALHAALPHQYGLLG